MYKHILSKIIIYHFSGTPPTNNKILNLYFLEIGTDFFFLEDLFMVMYITQTSTLVLNYFLKGLS